MHSAENTVNERLAQTPELYVLAIAQFALTAPDDHMRAFSLVLLRRLLFRAQPQPIDAPPASDPQSHVAHHSAGSGSASASASANHILYDRLSEPTRLALERALLHALLAEPAASVKHKASDAITDVANASFQRGRPWPQLSDALFKAMGADAVSRESAWRVVERCIVLSGEIPLEVFVRGLADTSVEVRLAAVKASASFLSASSSSSSSANSGTATLMARALSTLPNAPHSHLTRFLNALTPLASSHPSLFAPHLQDLLRFLPALIFNKKEYDAGPTPTVSRPFPSGSSSQGQGAFQFPPVQATEEDEDEGEGDEEEDELTQIRLAALELMVSLSEAKPGMVRRVDGWVASLVRACLEGMGELVDTEAELDAWVDAEVSHPFLSPSLSIDTCITAIKRPNRQHVPARIRAVARPALARAAGEAGAAARVPVHPADAREPRLAPPPRGPHGHRVHGRGRRARHAGRVGQGRQVRRAFFVCCRWGWGADFCAAAL